MSSRARAFWQGHLDKQTENNTYYRKVIHTNAQQQLVLMKLSPGQEIGCEVHPETSQFLRVEQGSGVVALNGSEYRVRAGYAVVVPPGTWHNVTAGDQGLWLYTVYSPPEHPSGCKQKTRPREG